MPRSIRTSVWIFWWWWASSGRSRTVWSPPRSRSSAPKSRSFTASRLRSGRARKQRCSGPERCWGVVAVALISCERTGGAVAASSAGGLARPDPSPPRTANDRLMTVQPASAGPGQASGNHEMATSLSWNCNKASSNFALSPAAEPLVLGEMDSLRPTFSLL